MSQQLYAKLNSLLMEWKDFCTKLTQSTFFLLYMLQPRFYNCYLGRMCALLLDFKKLAMKSLLCEWYKIVACVEKSSLRSLYYLNPSNRNTVRIFSPQAGKNMSISVFQIYNQRCVFEFSLSNGCTPSRTHNAHKSAQPHTWVPSM